MLVLRTIKSVFACFFFTYLINVLLEFLFEFVEVVHFVLLGCQVLLGLVDGLLHVLLLLGQLGDLFVLTSHLIVQGLDLVVLGLFVLFSLS